MDIASIYRRLEAGPGPLLARPIARILASLHRGQVTQDEAETLVRDALTKPALERTLDAEETRRRLADPSARQYVEWYTAPPPVSRLAQVKAITTGDDIDRVWPERA